MKVKVRLYRKDNTFRAKFLLPNGWVWHWVRSGCSIGYAYSEEEVIQATLGYIREHYIGYKLFKEIEIEVV